MSGVRKTSEGKDKPKPERRLKTAKNTTVKQQPPIKGSTIELKISDPNKKKKKFKMLSAFSILFIIITLLVFISWILHWTGITYQTGKTIQPMGVIDIFYSVFKGFLSKVDIIIFIITLGAFITIVVNTKALDGFAQSITTKLKGKEVYAIIPLMLFFSICGTVEGMAEESLGFYMICVPLLLAAGFDVFTGFLVVFLGAGIGTLASTVNPFVVTIAVDGINLSLTNLSETQHNGVIQFMSVGDGLVWRLVSWLTMSALAIGFVMWYALRVKKTPKKSITFSTYEGDKQFFLGTSTKQVVMDWKKKTTLIVFALVFVLMIMYLIGWDSILGTDKFEQAGKTINSKVPYLTALIPGFGVGGLLEVAVFFLIGAIVLGLVNGLGEQNFIKQFMDGASDILSVCLVIATAAGIGVILQESHMQELFVKGLSSTVGGIEPIGRIIVLYLVFIPLSFIIPSPSGFAAAVFPLLATTIATGTGSVEDPFVIDAIAGSGSVQAFSFASGLLNLFTPTSGVVMGALAISRIDYLKFLKGMMPILIGSTIVSIVLLAIGGAIGGTIA